MKNKNQTMPVAEYAGASEKQTAVFRKNVFRNAAVLRALCFMSDQYRRTLTFVCFPFRCSMIDKQEPVHFV